jgi:hypothetical protein
MVLAYRGPSPDRLGLARLGLLGEYSTPVGFFHLHHVLRAIWVCEDKYQISKIKFGYLELPPEHMFELFFGLGLYGFWFQVIRVQVSRIWFCAHHEPTPCATLTMMPKLACRPAQREGRQYERGQRGTHRRPRLAFGQRQREGR